MSEMIERVAKAMYASVLSGAGCATTLDQRPSEVREVWLAAARAAIEEMHEPTEAMLAVADSFGDYGREPWPEMIEAALKE